MLLVTLHGFFYGTLTPFHEVFTCPFGIFGDILREKSTKSLLLKQISMGILHYNFRFCREKINHLLTIIYFRTNANPQILRVLFVVKIWRGQCSGAARVMSAHEAKSLLHNTSSSGSLGGSSLKYDDAAGSLRYAHHTHVYTTGMQHDLPISGPLHMQRRRCHSAHTHTRADMHTCTHPHRHASIRMWTPLTAWFLQMHILVHVSEQFRLYSSNTVVVALFERCMWLLCV